MPHFTTTSSSLAGRFQGIRLAELPKTFRDAVIITRTLGVRYLWIDSLCIIQDDVKDWETESKNMAEVFQNSILTIAASASPDNRTGCFLQRESGRDLKVQHGKCTFYLQCINRDWSNPSPAGGPLQSRAWVLQEMLLSRRILFFSKDQLFWECHSMSLSEEGSSRAFDIEVGFPTMKQRLLKLEYWTPDTSKIAHQSPEENPILQFWLGLVQDYSIRHLTEERDVFAALAGLAEFVRNRSGDEFLAGMWKNTLHTELLWVARSKYRTSPSAWRAPSWSWAALKGEIYYADDPCRIMEPSAEFRHNETLWAGTPLSSTLVSGKLVVSGLIEPVAYIDDPIPRGCGMVPKYSLVKRDARSKEQYPYMNSWCIFDRGPPSSDRDIWCLCIAVERLQKRFKRLDLGDGYWVLLLTSTNTENGEYCRIGAGMIEAMPGTFGPDKVTVAIV